MAGKGPPPKPARLRQRTNRQIGAAVLEIPAAPGKAPTLPNPDRRKWHRLTRAWWRRVWQSPMASEYFPEYYKAPDKTIFAEIRLHEARLRIGQ